MKCEIHLEEVIFLKLTPAFEALLSFMKGSTINPYIITFVFVQLVGFCLGSGSATVSTSLPSLQEVFPSFVANGADIGVLHRITAIASHGSSALPQSGGVVAALQIFKTNHKESYMPVGVTCCLFPIIAGALVALPLAVMGFRYWAAMAI